MLLVQLDAHWQREGLYALAPQAVVDFLHTRLVAHRRPRVRIVAGWLGRIGSALAVHDVQLLGPGVVRRQVLVADRPRRRDPVVVLDLLEIALAEAEQNRTVDLGVATHVVVGVRPERLAVTVVPHLSRVVALVDEDLAHVPVLFLARQPVAAFEQQNALSRSCESIRQGAAARAGANDDHVVVAVSSHVWGPPQMTAAGAITAPVEPRVLWCVRQNRNSETPAWAITSVARFSMMSRPCLTFSVCGTRNGRSGSSDGTAP